MPYDDPDVIMFRALVNDREGRIFTAEYIETYLEIARRHVPYIAAALFAAVHGNVAVAEFLLRFSGGAKMDGDAVVDTVEKQDIAAIARSLGLDAVIPGAAHEKE